MFQAHRELFRRRKLRLGHLNETDLAFVSDTTSLLCGGDMDRATNSTDSRPAGPLSGSFCSTSDRQRVVSTALSASNQLPFRYLSGFASSVDAGQDAPSPSTTWVDRMPPAARPYLRLMRADKPIGTWLLLLPSLWSIALAAEPGTLPDLWTTALFSMGAFLLRGAGCTVNDLWDRDIDKQVERTRTRPIASGEVSVVQGIAFLGAQLTAGLAILLQLNPYTQLLGASSLLLVGSYPLMKRVTDWPQAFLGLTINWGALLGFAAVRGHVDWATCAPMYLAGACWTLVYDTIYAHQDKRDDEQVGVRSTARLFGDNTKLITSGFSAATISLLALSGYQAELHPAYYCGLGAAALHFAWQIRSVDLENPTSCMKTFVSNRDLGLIVLGAVIAGKGVGL